MEPMTTTGSTRAILAASLGNLLEWYDFAVYALFVVVVCACGLMAASFSGVAPTTLSGLFPTSVRATGVSLAYNAGFTLFGGFAPAILRPCERCRAAPMRSGSGNCPFTRS
jgi:MHS family proline/betaine transporter-like MFS transporter